MTKIFCDGCGKELCAENRPANGADRLTHGERYGRSRAVHGLMFEIITGKDGDWNTGDWCKYCILSAVAELDCRPKCEVKS